MSSLSQRQATTVYLLATAFGECNWEGRERYLAAVKRVEPFTIRGAYDHTMRRVQKNLQRFIIDVLDAGPDGTVTPQHEAAFKYMLHALCSDLAQECPPLPAVRKRSWRRLANAVADVIIAYAEPGDDGLGVELGCQWAEKVKGIWV